MYIAHHHIRVSTPNSSLYMNSRLVSSCIRVCLKSIAQLNSNSFISTLVASQLHKIVIRISQNLVHLVHWRTLRDGIEAKKEEHCKKWLLLWYFRFFWEKWSWLNGWELDKVKGRVIEGKLKTRESRKMLILIGEEQKREEREN